MCEDDEHDHAWEEAFISLQFSLNEEQHKIYLACLKIYNAKMIAKTRGSKW